MDTIHQLINNILQIDQYLFVFVSTYGSLAYVILFLIIFCETGLVVTPFLPGDSLLFSAGAIAANTSSTFNIQVLFIILFLASALGNKVNYLAGKIAGSRLSRFINQKHLDETHAFYGRHGGKTIIFARFIPIIRTIAPFVAGLGQMNLKTFSFYNLLSAALWIGSLLAAGYYFGNIPFIKNHFTLVIYGIILLSLTPPILTFCYQKWQKRQS